MVLEGKGDVLECCNIKLLQKQFCNLHMFFLRFAMTMGSVNEPCGIYQP